MKRTAPPTGTDKAALYDIRVRGRLRSSWSASLGGMTITSHENGDGNTVTALRGAVVDQAALRSILNHIWDLNLTVISVTRLDDSPHDE